MLLQGGTGISLQFFHEIFCKLQADRAKKVFKKKWAKTLDFFWETSIIIYVVSRETTNIARLCKGSTTDSDSVCLGSNPSRAAIKSQSFLDWDLYYLGV